MRWRSVREDGAAAHGAGRCGACGARVRMGKWEEELPNEEEGTQDGAEMELNACFVASGGGGGGGKRGRGCERAGHWVAVAGSCSAQREWDGMRG